MARKNVSKSKPARATKKSQQAKNKKKAGDKSVRQSHITLAVLLLILALASGFGVYSYQRYNKLQKAERCLTNIYSSDDELTETPDGQIADGMHYRNLDLAKLSYEEARMILSEQEEEQMRHLSKLKLIYAHPDEELAEDDPGFVELTPYQLGLRLDLGAILQEAKSESSKLLGRRLSLNEHYRVDQSAFEEAFNALVEKVDQEGRDAKATGFNFETAEFIFEDEQAGREMDQAKAKQEILKRLQELDFKRELTLPVNFTAPGRTAEELKPHLGLVASASTPILYYSEGRNKNISVAADRIQGTIVQPGESFSYKESIGAITAENGFVEAGVQDEYGNDDVGMGGGLCQPSTTLYIAAVRAGMRIDVHNFHSQPVSYTPLGTDCMVSDWSDFVFTNTTEYPYAIMSYFDGSTLSFSFYGAKQPDGNTIDLYVELIGETPVEEKPLEEEDPNLAPGETEVKVPPRPVTHVKVYRRYYSASGEVLKSELMYDHSYPGFRGVTKVSKHRETDNTTSPETDELGGPIYAPTAPPQEP